MSMEQEWLQCENFLSSAEWRKFQENAGRKTHSIESELFSASIIEHELPLVGKYFYLPRGPILLRHSGLDPESNDTKQILKQVQDDVMRLIDLANKENSGWIRIEPQNQESLGIIKKYISAKVVKAPHDMQPKEIFVLDITKSSENLLAEMKPKTRYNIGLAQKKGVKIFKTADGEKHSEEYVRAFLKITKEMATRQGIATHPAEYYQKMLETFPPEMLKIYVAEYDGKIIAANLVLFFEKSAIYLHGASSNLHRNVMAPFLLQWQAILDSKEKGCQTYDFGGIKLGAGSSWEGITNFKLGFSPKTKPVVFPGSYDIIINSRRYWTYRGLQRAKSFAVKLRK